MNDQALPGLIYHLCPASEFRAGLDDVVYTPARFVVDGFVHASAEPPVARAVAADYFADCAEPLLVLAIDPARLGAEVKLEAPALLPGGQAHLTLTRTFPHIYGPVARAAIVGVAEMARTASGFEWPEHFASLDGYLAGQAQ